MAGGGAWWSEVLTSFELLCYFCCTVLLNWNFFFLGVFGGLSCDNDLFVGLRKCVCRVADVCMD